MKQPNGCTSIKRVLPMSTGATNTLSLMWPTNLTQMFGKKLQITGDLSCIQVNYVDDFTKITRILDFLWIEFNSWLPQHRFVFVYPGKVLRDRNDDFTMSAS